MGKPPEHFDVLIVGAGLSGVGAGYHLQQKCPGKSYVILEGRDTIPAVQLDVDPEPDFVGVDEAALPYEDGPGDNA